MDIRLRGISLYLGQINWLLTIGFLMLGLMACIRPTLEIQPIYVEEMVMTLGIDEDGEPIDQVKVFKPDAGRIYCFARIPALANEKLALSWYYEDEKIGTVENVISSEGRVHWFLERPPSDPLFPDGQYHVEVEYKTEQLKSLSFRVEK